MYVEETDTVGGHVGGVDRLNTGVCNSGTFQFINIDRMPIGWYVSVSTKGAVLIKPNKQHIIKREAPVWTISGERCREERPGRTLNTASRVQRFIIKIPPTDLLSSLRTTAGRDLQSVRVQHVVHEGVKTSKKRAYNRSNVRN
eukprot:585869_1